MLTAPRIFSRLFVTAACANLMLIGFGGSAIAQERKPLRTLTVNGRGIVILPTSLTQARLAIEVQGKTPASTQQLAAKKANAVVAYLKSQQVEKLQTTGISLNPIYTYPPNGGQPKITGYTATNNVSFRVNNDRAGTILDEAVKAGASRIDSVSFVASEKAIANAQIQALKAATQDAQIQGDAVLSSLSLRRKEITGIQITSTSTPAPIPVAADNLVQKAVPTAAPVAPSPVVGGEQQVEASVSLDMSY
jgi:uncharacterized protein